MKKPKATLSIVLMILALVCVAVTALIALHDMKG
jgi:hypothetical protein